MSVDVSGTVWPNPTQGDYKTGYFSPVLSNSLSAELKCFFLSKVKFEYWGWRATAYNGINKLKINTTVSTSELKTFESLFCNSAVGIDTYAGFASKNLYSS